MWALSSRGWAQAELNHQLLALALALYSNNITNITVDGSQIIRFLPIQKNSLQPVPHLRSIVPWDYIEGVQTEA
jgi:hypothetical protein